MLTKCICTYCAGHLEFEEENAGEKIVCPHCGFETKLFLPGTQPPDPELTGLIRRLVRRRQIIWVGVGLILLAGVIYALGRWGIPFVQEQLPSVESKVVLWLVLLFACAVTPLALFWLAFPIILCFQVRKLTAVIAELVARLVTVTEQPAEGEAEAVATDNGNGEEALSPEEESAEANV
jgi:hypothetical protein